jgi:hypothetical protein
MLRIRETEGRVWEVPAGGVAVGFVEAGTYVVRIEGPGTRVLVDDAPLEKQPGHDAFIWRPGFYAGQVVAEVLDDQAQVLGSYALDVGPSPEKLGYPQFRRMVEEILALGPELLLGDGATCEAFGQEGDTASPEVAYARLRRYGPACLAALRIVLSSPLTRLRQQRRTLMPHQARRLDTLTVLGLARSRLAGHLLGVQDVPVDAPAFISVPYVEQTFDNAANRAIAVVVDRLTAQTAWLCRRFADSVDDVENLLTLKVPRRLYILGEFHDALRRLRGSRALSAVTRPEITAAGLNAISAQPAYARAFQLAWKALRTGILEGDSADSLPISPTWEVFERWCFLRVRQLLDEIAPDAGWKVDSRNEGSIKLCVSGVVGDVVITVHLQPTFPAWDQRSVSGFKSLSRLREPDLVVTCESPHDRKFLVLDAKYRATRPNVLDAMQSAHIYRDSLMWQGERPWGSYLLLPRHGAVDWLGDATFHTDFEVGTFELAPYCDATRLKDLLIAFLARG